jgi:hypothetical protein
MVGFAGWWGLTRWFWAVFEEIIFGLVCCGRHRGFGEVRAWRKAVCIPEGNADPFGMTNKVLYRLEV